MKPSFKYHPDPVASGVFLEASRPCPSCGVQRELGYVGPLYATEEVTGICPACIADGSAARKWDAEFVDPGGPEPLDDPEKLDELLHRTPGYFSAQGDPWPIHCDDYCALLGQVASSQIATLSQELEDDLLALEQALGLSRAELVEELSRDASPLWAHLFRCLRCGRHRLVADYEQPAGRTLAVTHEPARSEMSVDEFLAVLAPPIRRIVAGLRKLSREAAPGATESVLWGSLSYHVPELGGRVKGAVCLITPRQGYVELGFIHGALLPDPARLLAGQQKEKRVFRVQSLEKLPRRELTALIRAAREVRPRAPSLRVARPRRT